MPHFSSPSKTLAQGEPVALAWRDSAQRLAVRTPGSGLLVCSALPHPRLLCPVSVGRRPLLDQIQLMLLWLWQGPAVAVMEGLWSQLRGCGSAGSHLGLACATASRALLLFPWVLPDSLTSASPHPTLGNHLPFS